MHYASYRFGMRGNMIRRTSRWVLALDPPYVCHQWHVTVMWWWRQVLRQELDKHNLTKVQIVAADGSFGKIANETIADKELNKSVAILGCALCGKSWSILKLLSCFSAHYPGTYSTVNASKSGKPLWASEDYSTFNNKTGAGCWARVSLQSGAEALDARSWPLCFHFV